MKESHDSFERVVVGAGAEVFREGDIGVCAYFIERGRVAMTLERNGEVIKLAERGPGEMFGEMAIIDRRPRTATVKALQDAEFLIITQEQLDRRLEDADPILRICLQVILNRYRDTVAQLGALQVGDAPALSAAASANAAEIQDAAAAMQEIKLERELETAIQQEDFELHFQPIVDLSNGWLAGFESLVRWRHETRGLISPMVFIPTAEASGLIVPLGRLCLEQACAGLSSFTRLREGAPRVTDDLFVSVNVSGRDFNDRDFVAHIGRTLDAAGADPRRLKLEITETMLMQHPERAVQALEQCRFKGLSIAIDDFGTGYSSLGYLHKFPIDTLKIDRSFVMAMHDDARSMKIIQSILTMARQLNIPVVAEGIETEKDAIVLRDLGCEYGQGYHFARPMPRGDAEATIVEWPGFAALESFREAV